MKQKSTSRSAFFHLRLLIGLCMVLSGVFLALSGFGTFSAKAEQAEEGVEPAVPLVPPMFDCAQVYQMGLDVQENLKAGAIMIYCGEAQGGAEPDEENGGPDPLMRLLLGPLALGTTDRDVV